MSCSTVGQGGEGSVEWKANLKGVARLKMDSPPYLYKQGYHIVFGTMDVILFTHPTLIDIRGFSE